MAVERRTLGHAVQVAFGYFRRSRSLTICSLKLHKCTARSHHSLNVCAAPDRPEKAAKLLKRSEIEEGRRQCGCFCISVYIVGHAPMTVAAGGGNARTASGAIVCTVNLACGVILLAIIGADVENPDPV